MVLYLHIFCSIVLKIRISCGIVLTHLLQYCTKNTYLLLHCTYTSRAISYLHISCSIVPKHVFISCCTVLTHLENVVLYSQSDVILSSRISCNVMLTHFVENTTKQNKSRKKVFPKRSFYDFCCCCSCLYGFSYVTYSDQCLTLCSQVTNLFDCSSQSLCFTFSEYFNERRVFTYFRMTYALGFIFTTLTPISFTKVNGVAGLSILYKCNTNFKY